MAVTRSNVSVSNGSRKTDAFRISTLPAAMREAFFRRHSGEPTHRGASAAPGVEDREIPPDRDVLEPPRGERGMREVHHPQERTTRPPAGLSDLAKEEDRCDDPDHRGSNLTPQCRSARRRISHGAQREGSANARRAGRVPNVMTARATTGNRSVDAHAPPCRTRSPAARGESRESTWRHPGFPSVRWS